jgi:hypothetical protein
VRRIALLFAYDEGNSEVQGWLATFRDGLAKLGWIEGQNLHFEFRFTGSDTTLMEKAVKGIIVGVHDRTFNGAVADAIRDLIGRAAIPLWNTQ